MDLVSLFNSMAFVWLSKVMCLQVLDQLTIHWFGQEKSTYIISVVIFRSIRQSTYKYLQALDVALFHYWILVLVWFHGILGPSLEWFLEQSLSVGVYEVSGITHQETSTICRGILDWLLYISGTFDLLIIIIIKFLSLRCGAQGPLQRLSNGCDLICLTSFLCLPKTSASFKTIFSKSSVNDQVSV